MGSSAMRGLRWDPSLASVVESAGVFTPLARRGDDNASSSVEARSVREFRVKTA